MYVPNDAVDVSAHGAVRVVTLNRPETRNAVDRDIKECLLVVWDALADDLDVGAVVLTGAGRAFCAGGDISDFAQVTNDREYRRRVRLRQARRMIDAMIACPLPIIAAVNGPAVGLGCSLAALADIVLAGEDCFFADPHVSVGLVAGDGGAAVWPLLMSLLRAKEYLLTGDRIPADEALRIGLVNHVYPNEELLGRAIDLATRLAAQPRQALQETKRALNIHIQRAVVGVLDMAIAAESESFTTDDHAARVNAFLQKTPGTKSERDSG